MRRFIERILGKKVDRVRDKVLNLDQREFDRYPLDLPALVYKKEKSGHEEPDKAVLHDISGSGAMFIPLGSRIYRPGERLCIAVNLAGTDEVRARVITDATVVRVHPVTSSLNGEGHERVGVAVRFDGSFSFERLDL